MHSPVPSHTSTLARVRVRFVNKKQSPESASIRSFVATIDERPS
jgi:hypothetical protein